VDEAWRIEVSLSCHTCTCRSIFLMSRSKPSKSKVRMLPSLILLGNLILQCSVPLGRLTIFGSVEKTGAEGRGDLPGITRIRLEPEPIPYPDDLVIYG